ncbi:MAG: hypothetical protein AAGD35_14680 [Actinomycetota bacterium]
MPSTSSLLALLLTFALAAAACTTDDGPVAEGVPASTAPDTTEADDDDGTAPDGDEAAGAAPGSGAAPPAAEAEPPTLTPAERALVADLPGLLAVGAGSGLRITDPAGATELVITDVPAISAGQATWSPDGRRLAWSRSTVGGHEIVVTPADGSPDSVSAAAGPAAIFLQWSAGGERIAYLRNDPGGRGIQIGTAVPGEPAVPLLAAGPLYLGWSPSAPELALHVSGQQVLRANEAIVAAAEGEDRPGPDIVLETSGGFTAPAWLDERTVVVAVDDGLGLLDVNSGRVERLLEGGAEIQFVVSPDRRRLAYHIVGSTPGVSPIQAQGDGAEPLPGLAVLDLDRRVSIPVAEVTPQAFEWSPDGTQLAFLTGAGDQGPGLSRWSFWDGTDITSAPPYTIATRDLASTLPFFEQYAPSHRRWSPDGRAFVMVGAAAAEPSDATSGVLVHLVGTDEALVRVANGDYAFWSS